MKQKPLVLIGVLALSMMFALLGLNTEIFAEGENRISSSSDETINIDVEKDWKDGNNAEETRPESITVELKNGDTVVDTLTITPDEDEKWEGVFEDVPRFDDDGNEIQYTVSEQPVDGYKAAVEQGEIVSDYDYPTNVSEEELDTDTTTSDKVNVHGGTNWFIQQGLRTDYIEGTEVVFNTGNLPIAKATLTEYDAQGNLVPNAERVFWKTNGSGTNQADNSANGTEIRYKPQGTYPTNTVVSTDHYIILEFPNAVTVLDGTDTGSQRSVKIKVDNVSIYKTKNQNWHRILYAGLWAGPGDTNHSMGGQSIDMTFIIDGVTKGNVLLSFGDVDVVSDSHEAGASRRESVYLADGFDKTIYTIPLNVNTANETSVRYTYFAEQDGTMRAYAKGQDGAGSLESGFVTRAIISEDGFTLRWTGTSCATSFFTQIKPFKLKVTVDENTVTHNGGSITEQGAWRYRDYGEAKAITITPDTGYHVRYLKIDGRDIALDGFNENGYMEVSTGYSVVNNPSLNPGTVNNGTETVKLYQRENGVIDVYLPAQYFAVDNTAPNRVDHWIDTGFESNGLAENYTITNTLVKTLEGTKTWVSGNKEHVDNSSLNFTLKQKLSTQDDSEAVEYPFDKTNQMTWDGGNYVISGLPAYDADGNKYEYLVSETAPAGYDVTQDGNDLINTLKQEYITVQGKKTWKDGGKSHNNAEEVIVTLKRAEWNPELERYGSAEAQQATPEWTGDTYVFDNLPKYDENRYEYRYTVEEAVADSINTDPAKGDYYDCKPDDTGKNFVNTLKGVTTFSGTKTWLDGGKEHNNAQDITLVLYRESAAANKRQVNNVTPAWDGNTYTYTNLPKYDDEGNLYTYSVRESRVMGKNSNVADYEIYYDGELWDFSSYDTPQQAYSVTGKDVTNALKGSVTVSKKWEDDSNRDGVRPDSITVQLYANGDKLDGKTLTLSKDSDPAWKGTFTALSLYDGDGNPIQYSVTENPIEDASGEALYTAAYSDQEWNADKTGYTLEIENTHEIEKIDIPVEKEWVDGDDADEMRPDDITVQLYADGDAVEGKTLTLSDPEWKDTFTELPKNKEGEVSQAIEYSVKEVNAQGGEAAPEGYIAKVTKTKDGFKVTNTHVTYVKTKLAVMKTLTGRDMADKEFEFTIEPADDATAAAVDNGKIDLPDNVKAPAAADGVVAGFAFDHIVFKADGTYKFEISEIAPEGGTADGVYYDTNKVTVTIVVEEADNKLIVRSITNGDKLSFKNEYRATGDFTPEGTKTLTGQSETGEDEIPAEETPQQDQDLNTENGNADNGDDADKIKAAERTDAEEETADEVEADAEEPAEEEIAEEETADEVEADAEEPAADETAEEEAAAETGADAEEPAADETAEEEAVEAEADAEKPAADETAEEEAAVEVEADAEEPSADEIAEEEAVEGATMTVKGKAMPEPEAKASKGEEVAMSMEEGMFKFEGRYANGSDTDTIVFEGKNEAAAAGETADITFDKISYTTAGLKALVNSGAATKDDAGKYHISYVITEKAPSDAFQHNPQAFTMEVVIEDNGKGKLTATAETTTEIAFTNRYVTDTAIVPLDGLKRFSTQNGTKTLKEGDFSFTVTPLDGAPASEKETAENDAGGAIHFGDIEFTKADIGDADSKTFTYEIKEDQGDLHGMTYDAGTKTVKITVTDDGKGHLTAATDPEEAPLFEFENTYEPDPVSETVNEDIEIIKVLKGGELADGQFEFKISAADDETQTAIDEEAVVMPDAVTAANDADGNIAFGAVTYNKAGTYQFLIQEVIPEDAADDIIFDKTVYTAVVTVSDDEEGHLVIDSQTLSGGAEKAEFTNEQINEPPDEPDEPDEPGEPDEPDEPDNPSDNPDNPDNPDEPEKDSGTKTGDDMNLLIPILLLLASAAGAAGVIRMRRRKA